nr:MAG TPA: muramidase [Caudoviricetes sp.]
MPVRQVYEPNLNIGAQSGWCLQYVDDAISSLTRSPNAQTAYLNELNAGRINTGPAPVGIWVVGFLGFSIGQYVDDGHVFLMRKRADGSIEIHDSEVHSGARGIYNSIEELMNWMGNYGPDYLGYSYCCDGRCIAEDYDETQPTDRKMEEDGNARDEANTNSAVFQELEKGDVIAMKGYVTNGQPVAGDTVWYVTARSGKYMSRQLFTDKDLHDLPDLTPQSAPQPKPEEPQEDYSKIILDVSNHQDDSIVNHFNKFAGVILKAGHVGQSFGGDANKIDPKLVKFAKAAGDQLLGIYWLPYFSTEEEAKTEAEHFIEAQKLVNAPLLFVDLEPDFEGTSEQLKAFKNLVLQKTGKQVFTYAGEAIIQKLGLDRVDWYPNYGTKDNYAHGALIHQFTDTGKIDGYGGNLDFSTAKVSIDELKALGKITTPTPPEEPESPKPSEPDTKPSEPEKPQEVPNNKPKEGKMATPVFTKEDIEAIEKVTAEKAKLAQGLAETDEAQEIIKGISKRTKLVVYIIGDLLLGASAIAPQVAIAVLSGDPYVKINAISGALATAGLFLLTMFGIYKNGKNK